MTSKAVRGTVFNIQHYSLHDGPGIRTVVFLKGCPLRCAWCSNPESQRAGPQVYFDKDKCICDKGCRFCGGVCSENALSGGRLDFTRCTDCLACTKICPSGAVAVYGREMCADEVVEQVEREQVFYRHGSGGLTLSGGEPLAQADFATDILRIARRHHIHTAIETCGYVDTNRLLDAAQYLDYILYDVKLIDEQRHRQATGVSNRLILNNLRELFVQFPQIPKCIRTPVIPGINDNEDDIRAVIDFLQPYQNYRYELLPYHRFGEKKYQMLGRRLPDFPPKLCEAKLDRLKALIP